MPVLCLRLLPPIAAVLAALGWGSLASAVTIDFATPIRSFGFDLIDVENATQENGSVSFECVAPELSTITWAGLQARDASIAFGDNTANRIEPLTEMCGPDGARRVVIALGGSGAVDRLEFTAVPEPSALGLFGTGIAALGAARRRRG